MHYAADGDGIRTMFRYWTLPINERNAERIFVDMKLRSRLIFFFFCSRFAAAASSALSRIGGFYYLSCRKFTCCWLTSAEINFT